MLQCDNASRFLIIIYFNPSYLIAFGKISVEEVFSLSQKKGNNNCYHPGETFITNSITCCQTSTEMLAWRMK